MMISIGDRHFIASEYIVEILRATDTRADPIRHAAAESGMLIDAAGGKNIRSIIRLKSRHIVLSALEAESLRSKLKVIRVPAAPADKDAAGRKRQKRPVAEPKPAEFKEQRIEPDRRRFSYTHYIPERRSGVERRRKKRRRAACRPAC
jgi:regulator of extracellular matrix RemA (YlzA/DUF370 family)